MVSFSEAELLAWLSPLFWPFVRVLALFSALPILGQRMVPARVRVGLAALIVIAAQASMPAMPQVALDSLLAFAGPWMMSTLIEYLQRTLQSIPGAVG